ncbi:hypothetical protein BDZ91DRAFT_847796 [Kalaharituber pfeilii]|nr:hypothetical protein BDZ91DRAFT_847796 [Kalaharituber pfeilii]
MDSNDDTIRTPPKSEIKRITQGIQDTVKEQFLESGDAETLTVNSIRSKAEAKLGLEKNFLRTAPFWRKESKEVIRAEFERQNDAVGDRALPKKAEPKKRSRATARKQVDERGHLKKPSKAKSKATSSSGKEADIIGDAELQVEEASDVEEEPPTRKKRPRTTPEDVRTTTDKQEQLKKGQENNDEDADSKRRSDEEKESDGEESAKEDSESELSEVLDLPPKRKKQRSRGGSEAFDRKKSSSKPAQTGKGKKAKSDEPVDADAEKIKELQGWLLKCGVRKLWGKELAKFSTSKEKITHLKDMLVNLGMTGRYSNEKAKKIKEERELAEELAAVQAGAKVWGTGNGDQMKTRSSRVAEPQVKRKLVRPPELAFLDDQSESE